MENPGPSQRGRLIDAVAPPGPNWVVHINDCPFNMSYLCNDEIWDRSLKLTEFLPPNTKNIDWMDLILVQAVDEKPDQLFDYMVQQCTAAQNLIIGLAQHLSGKSVSTVCERIFKAKDLSDHFVKDFYATFFPAYLKRKYSWFSLQLLIRAHACRPVLFKMLFKILIQDVEIPWRTLQDFVVNMKESERDGLMKAIMDVEYTPKQFIYHLPTINLLYAHSDKSTEVCQCVLDNLEAFAFDCYDNRNYGRLLLALLKNLGQTNVSQRTIKHLIDIHGTEYKLPCLMAFDEIIGEMVALQYQEHGFPRFYIDRPAEVGYRIV